jgi:hypothetical protein
MDMAFEQHHVHMERPKDLPIVGLRIALGAGRSCPAPASRAASVDPMTALRQE